MQKTVNTQRTDGGSVTVGLPTIQRNPLRTLRGQLIKRRPSRKDNPKVHHLTNILIGQIDSKNRGEAGPGHDVAMQQTINQLATAKGVIL